jgi:hypothetical protein
MPLTSCASVVYVAQSMGRYCPVASLSLNLLFLARIARTKLVVGQLSDGG